MADYPTYIFSHPIPKTTLPASIRSKFSLKPPIINNPYPTQIKIVKSNNAFLVPIQSSKNPPINGKIQLGMAYTVYNKPYC